MQPWVPVWSSPPLPGWLLACLILGPQEQQEQGCGISVPGRAAVGALAHHAQTAQGTSSPHPAGLGGRKQLRTTYWGFCGHYSSGGSVGKRCSYGGTRCLSFSWDIEAEQAKSSLAQHGGSLVDS